MRIGGKSVKARLGSVGLAAAAVLGGTGSVLILGAAPSDAATPHVTASTGGVYTALSPTRVADTRFGSGYQDAGSPLGAGTSAPVNLGGDVPATATAVVLNVTATDATQNTYFSVYPTGDTGNYTSFSNINVLAGVSQPNLVIVPLGTGESVQVYNYAGTADAVVDLEGYFAPTTVTTPAGEFYPLNPARITDTRVGSGQPNAGSTLSAGSTLNVQVTGTGGVPSSGVSAVELNVTATNTTGSSYFTVYPTGGAKPTASNLNWVPNQTIPNRVIVPVGSNGQISIFNYAGTAAAVVDVDGYFSSGTTTTTGDVFTPVAPARISDTRSGSGYPNAGVTLTTGTSESVQVTGVGPVPATSATAPIGAAVLNITEATATANSFLTVYPPGGSLPLASDLNFPPGFIVANADLAELGPSGNVNIYNYAGSTNVVVDVFGYFTPASPTTVTVSASPSSLTANGTSTSNVSATVTTNGVAASGDTVTFSVSPASCGTISPTSAITGANGTTTAVTYTSSTTNEVCTVTARESAAGQSGSSTITQSGATTNTLVITATPQSVTANGTTTSMLSIAAIGAGAPNETVTLTGFPSAPGSCGTFPASVVTGANGAATATYTSSTVVGSCTILASAAANGTTGTVVIVQTPVSTVYAAAVALNPSVIQADGTSMSGVTAGVTQNGSGLANDVVTFTLGQPSEAGSCGALASATETTGATGVTPADAYTASTVPGTCTITIKEAAGGAVAATFITQQLTANTGVLITAVPTSVTANGTSTSTLTVDAIVNGAGVSGDTVTLGGVPTPAGSCGTFPASVVTGANGAVTATYTSSTVQGTCTILATGPAGTGTGTVSISQTAAANVFSQAITATPNVVIANGSSTSNVLDNVTDNGAAVPGDVVAFTEQPSVANACGTLTSATETTGANGTTPTDTYTASSTVGTCTITAKETAGGVSSSVVITQQASVSSEVIITATPEQVAADGASTSSLTVGVFTNGAAVNGASVAVTGTPGVTGSCGSFPATLTTGANGLASGTYTSSTVPGTCTLLATGPAGTGTATISQTPVAAAYNEAITATPSSLSANGTATSSILVGVTKNGAAFGGDVVTFTKQPSVPGACGTLSSATETTAANGITPSDTYTASSTVGTCTIIATEADGNVSANVAITQTTVAPVATKVIVSASPNSLLLVGDTSTITVQTVSATGVAVPNQTITLTDSGNGLLGACGTLGANTGTTNSSGVLTVTYTVPNLAGILGLGLLATCTVTATDTSVTPNISGSASITETIDLLALGAGLPL